jgi:uncharacterized protein (TIGR03437 family)
MRVKYLVGTLIITALSWASAQQYVITPPVVQFTYPTDSADGPSPQTVRITSPSGSIPFSLELAIRTGGIDFISLSVSGNVTPATLTITPYIPYGLTPGYYAQNFFVHPPGQLDFTVEGGASLTVTLPPPPKIMDVVNDASLVQGPIAPGEIIAIRGTDLGIRDYQYTALDPGKNSTVVTFDGIPATLLTAFGGQIRAVVPYALAGQTVAHLTLTHYGIKSDVLELPVLDTAPAVYSADGSGTGQGAIVNHDGSINDLDHPARRDVAIYMVATGEGVLNPPVLAGSSNAKPQLTQPTAPVSVTIGGQPAAIENLAMWWTRTLTCYLSPPSCLPTSARALNP